MEEDRILRVTMRYDNLYSYHTNVQCEQLDPNESNTSGPYGADISKKNCTLVGGYVVALLQEIIWFFNLKLEIAGDVWGYDFQNATANAIDLFVNAYVLRKERVELVDPTFIIHWSKLNVFLNHEYESASRNIVWHSFESNVWLGLSGIVVVSLASLVLIHRTRKNLTEIQNQENGTNIIMSTADILFEGISTLLQRGTFVLYSESVSIRLALCFMSSCSFMCLVYFSGSIVAILSVPSYEITSLSALIKSSYDIQLDKGFGNGSSNQIIVEQLSGKDQLLQAFLKKASKNKRKFDTFEKTIYEVRDGPLALFTEDDTALGAISNTISTLPCSWSQIDVQNIKYSCVMFMKKNSPFKNQINSLLLRMSQAGIMKYHKKKWIGYATQDTCQESNSDFTSAKMINLSAAFIIQGVGMFLAGLAIIFEILIATKPYFCRSIKYMPHN